MSEQLLTEVPDDLVPAGVQVAIAYRDLSLRQLVDELPAEDQAIARRQREAGGW